MSTQDEASNAKRAIRNRIIELASRRRVDASGLKDSDVIPESGLLDSAGIMELIVWFEMTFGVTVDQSDLTIENFGSIDAMATYLRHTAK